MVQILEERPSFGSLLGQQLGSGFSQAIAKGLPEVLKSQQRKKLLTEIENRYGIQNKGVDLAGLAKKDAGQNFSQQINQDPFAKAKAYAAAGEHDLSRIAAEEGKQERKERFSRESSAEPKLQELEDKASSYEHEAIRFDRLNELFSPELESQFPSSLNIGLFTDKEGNLSPKISGVLSPEAQEAVKLVADNLTGAKDTFGARVTNFDLQAYMKRLPTLLNSAEGRRRVLRDLRIMNTINKEHAEGVLNTVEKYGGPSQISLSKAERIFKKDYAPRMKELREEFVNPDKKSFSSLPDASLYSGRKFVDESTGQVLISDGKQWVPE